MYIQGRPEVKRSWHILQTWTRVPATARVWCGRRASGEVSDVLPEGEKSCESCFRRKAKAEEA
jgi:hypothetical protein